MHSTVTGLVLLVLFILGLSTSYVNLEQHKTAITNHPAYTTHEAHLFPEGRALRAIAFGYNNFLSNILWFNTINYFGKHYQGDKNYTWLAHMCGIVFSLDPHARHVPEFCALMLAWEANKPEQALTLLDTAITRDPEYWRYYYLRGISRIIFLNDAKLAKDDFFKGSKISGAPMFMTRLATKTLANLENPAVAIAFLQEQIRQARDAHERAVLERHLKQTIHDTKLMQLEKLVAAYAHTHGALPEALDVLVEKDALQDPYGGIYIWDAEEKKIRSTSGVPPGKIYTGRLKNKVTE